MSWLKNENVENRINELFDKYVPVEGACETLGGEIIRAISKIVYRWFNDGDKIGVDYGIETCNAPAHFLEEHGFKDEIEALWGCENYEEELSTFCEKCLEKLDDSLFTTKNTEDMYDYEDEDDWGDYEDECEDDEE